MVLQPCLPSSKSNDFEASRFAVAAVYNHFRFWPLSRTLNDTEFLLTLRGVKEKKKKTTRKVPS